MPGAMCTCRVGGPPREHRPAAAEVFWLRGDELHPADDILSADPNDEGLNIQFFVAVTRRK